MLQQAHQWASALWPLWLMALLIGIAAWAFWPGNRARFRRDAEIPLRDDQPPIDQPDR
jgi:cytochrome c oxidase cbb3-type subunit 4